jgi:hypothetical protein
MEKEPLKALCGRRFFRVADLTPGTVKIFKKPFFKLIKNV